MSPVVRLAPASAAALAGLTQVLGRIRATWHAKILRLLKVKELKMKRPYRNIGFFFLLLLALVIAGFTPRVPDTPFFGYFSHIRQSSPVPLVIHLHAIAAIAWFTLLSIQPFLIRANRLNLHRLLGKASIVLVILFFFTAIQVMKHFYTQNLVQLPRDTVLSSLTQSFTALSLLLLFYSIALLKRRNIYQHVAFMIAAALASAIPGLARLGLYVVGGLPGILIVLGMIYATLIGFMIHAKIRFHQPVSRSPYLLIIPLFLAANAMDFVGSQTAAWLWLADKIVTVW